jgi:hypothetical protein
MASLQRIRRDVRLALLVGAALLACGAAAAESPQRRCQKDALENWYCATDEKGVAVVDNLGVVLCSPGACIEVEDAWQCSAVSGGRAAFTPNGPICDGGCRAPRSVDCARGSGPTSSKAPARLFPAPALRTRSGGCTASSS